MVQCFLVHPNLKITSCEQSLSEDKMNSKKSNYLNSLNELKRRKEGTKSPENSDDCDCTMKPIEEISEIYDIYPYLQSICLSEHPELFLKKAPSSTAEVQQFKYKMLPILLNHRSVSESNNLIYLGQAINLDLRLLEYLYMKTSKLINETINQHFSNDESLSMEEEEKGCKIVGLQMEFSTHLENLITVLRIGEGMVADLREGKFNISALATKSGNGSGGRSNTTPAGAGKKGQPVGGSSHDSR